MSTTCAACGQAVASSAAFCIGCGQPVPRACSQCGAPVSAGANWCATCGSKVGAAAAPAGATAPAPQPPLQPTPPWATPVAVAGRPGGLMRAARRRPVLIAGAAVAVVAVLVATTVFSGRLPWNSPSIPLVETTMQAPTVIDVPTDDYTLSIVPGKGDRLDTEGAALVIPAGAAVSNTTVTVKVLQAPFHMTLGQPPQDGQAYASAVGPVVDFGPTGTTFNEPVTISVPYEHTFLPAGMSEDSIRPAYWNGQSWVVLPGVVDKDAHTVSVKLKDFKGTALVTYVVVGAAIVAGVGYTVNYAIQNWGELKWSDPVTKGTAKQYVTPGSATVKKYAAEAVITDAITHVQMPLNDPKMPDWLAAGNAQGHAMNLGYLDASTGKLLEIHHDEGKGSNWQKPDDFFTRGDALGPGNGDCTDSANSSVSVFIAAGFRAKAVFGYNEGDKDPKDAGHQHLWAEVFIGGKPYRMDEGGIYSPANWTHSNLPTYTPASGLDRHSTSMFDDQGQASYDEQWWKKTEVSVVATPTSGTTYAFKATAWAIPNSAQQVEFVWDFGDGSKDTKDVRAPYASPLVADTTHEVKGASTVTVVLYDITSQTPVELARAHVTVLPAAPSASPSAVASTSVSTGYWQYVETKNFPDPPPVVKTDYDVTADGAHFSRVVSRPDEKPATWAFSCTWSISSPTDPDRLTPGSSVEGTASCTDTSDAVGYYVSGVTFAIEPLGIPSYDGGTWGPEMTFGLRETKTLKGSLIVPAGPRASAPWNGQICVQFSLGQVGFTQRIYNWVPGGA